MRHDQNSPVIALVESLVIPTYREPAAEALPMFAENRVHQRTSGNPYPCRVVVRTDRRQPMDKIYTSIRLENDYIRLVILPELGGRIFTATDKLTGYDFFYRQHVIKPALIGVLGSWISGGVEFNFPFHHRPSTYMPVDYTIERREDGEVIVWLSEHDPIERMKGMVGISLCPGQSIIRTQMKIYNRTPVSRSFLWWENAAVPVNEQYQIFFPPDVRYVNFHYHRSVTTFPAAQGVYNGIRMGAGTDITWHRHTRAPTSYFSAPSRYDFFGGYDHGRGCGVVHVADRHTSPGKKMFTWAYNQLARSWERALTDSDGAYAELMAGSYSDNQPDFAWLAPYETKAFEQCWYPIAGIGTPVFANRLLALSLQREPGQVVLRLQATRRLDQAAIIIRSENGELLRQSLTLTPGDHPEFRLPDSGSRLQIKIEQDSRMILAYTEASPDDEPIPDPWQDLPAPGEEHTAQDLYLLGLHVRQYRDPCVLPDVYWLAALEKDPDHVPTLIALGEYLYQTAQPKKALVALERAKRILTRHNGNPEDGRIFYLLGLVLQELGHLDQAGDAWAKAAWNKAQRAAALTRLAGLDGLCGDWQRMLDHIQAAISDSGQNGLAQAYLAIALQRNGLRAEALASLAKALSDDPLNQLARLLATLFQDLPLPGFIESLHGDRSQTILDLAFDLKTVGMNDAATQLLEETLNLSASSDSMPMVAYTLALLKPAGAIVGRTMEDCLELGQKSRNPSCFPSRLEELPILRQIVAKRPYDANAWYLLGCVLYGKRQYDEAAGCWERCLQIDPQFAAPRRNLAVAWYSHLERRADALPMLREAYKLNPGDEQVLFEICHVMTRTGVPPQERADYIAAESARLGLDCLGQAKPGCQPLRPDIVLEWSQALNQSGRWEDALELLAAHRFVPCEGGEHAVAEQYLFANHALGRRFLLQNNPAAALEHFRQAQHLPDTLGGGFWHEAWLVPHQYYEAYCLERLGHPEDAQPLYAHIAALSVDYFSNMHLPGLPCWQGMALLRLGRADEAGRIIQAAEKRWQDALIRRDAGYFKSTPFFISYMDNPETMRKGLFMYLIGMAQAARGDLKSARRSWQASQQADPALLFCWLELEMLKDK